METSPQAMENRQEKTVSLLRDLQACLERERESLLEVNVPDLWTIMEEKQGILEAIEGLGPADGASPDGRGHRGPGDGAVPNSTLRIEMDRLKEDIRFRARENAEFIRGSLAVFDELISRIAGTGRDDQTYRPSGSAPRAHRDPIYRRKV